VGTYYRNDPLPILLPRRPPGAAPQLHILVEAMGRNNFAFGAALYQDPKGLVGNVTLGDVPLANWAVQPLELEYESLGGLQWRAASGPPQRQQQQQQQAPGNAAGGSAAAAGAQQGGGFRPTFFRGWLNATGGEPSASSSSGGGGGGGPADTFLHMGGWDKGYVWVNGHNLGRYWQSQGPQRTLYLPGPWLHADKPNEVVVLELSRAPGSLALHSVAVPDFGGREVRA
jgi:hypothetical protein